MGLQPITKYIVLDISKNKYVPVTVNQYDKNIQNIIVTVTDYGKPYPIDSTVIPRVKGKKSDNNNILNDCTVLENGTVNIEVTPQMTVVEGLSTYELVLFDAANERVLHTMDFVLSVQKGVFENDEEITSTDEFNTLEEALLKADTLEVTLETANELVEKMDNVISNVEASETTRNQNEQERIDAEAEHVTNEENRVSNEETRIENENTRIENEKVRVTAEAERQANEEIRQEGYKEIQESISNVKSTSSATGSQILLTDSADGKVIDFSAYGRSEQTQYSGKNLLPITITSNTSNGIDYTINDDNSILADGTTDGLSTLSIIGESVKSTYAEISNLISGNTYILNGCPSNGELDVIQLQLSISHSDGTYDYSHADIGEGVEFTHTEGDKYLLYIRIENTTVENLIFCPMISTEGGEYEPYVGGTTSPNPDYPQEIVSVSDKGYFDGELLQGYYKGTDGTYGNIASYVCSKNMIPCSENDVIKLMYEEVAPYIVILFYDANKNYISYNQVASASEFSVTVPTNASYFHFDINNSNITPANAKHICVTINGMYALIVKRANKNLLPSGWITTANNGISYTLNEDGSVSANGLSTGYASSYQDYTLPVGTYIYTGCPSGGSDSTYNQGILLNGKYAWEYGNGLQFTLTEKTSMRFYTGRILNGTTVNGLTFYPMLRRVEVTDDIYEPYKETTTYIPIAEPLRGIGEVKDEIVKQNGIWGVLRRVASVVLNGSETWYYASSLISGVSRKQCASLSNVKYVDGNGIIANILCSHYIPGAEVDGYRGTKQCISTLNGYRNRVAIYDTTYNGSEDLEDYKAWLAENPITVQYELATETFEPFADQTPFYEMKTFDGVTLISSDAEMEISYYKNSQDGQTLADVQTKLQSQINDKLSVSDLVAGSNITITEDGDKITISSTGGGGEVPDGVTYVDLDEESETVDEPLPIGTASLVTYNNTDSGLDAITVQDAIDEVAYNSSQYHVGDTITITGIFIGITNAGNTVISAPYSLGKEISSDVSSINVTNYSINWIRSNGSSYAISSTTDVYVVNNFNNNYIEIGFPFTLGSALNCYAVNATIIIQFD